MLTGNILTSLSAIILSIYTTYYAQKLTRLIKSPQIGYKRKIRTKIILMTITILMVLFLRTLTTWSHRGLKRVDYHKWIWPTFLFIYSLLSDIIPFLIFLWLLLKQVRYFEREYKKIQGDSLINGSTVEDKPPADVRTPQANSEIGGI